MKVEATLLDYFHQLSTDAKGITPAMPCPRDNVEAYRRWRPRFRRKLVEMLGGFPAEKCDLSPKLTGEEDKGNYRLLKYVFSSEPENLISAYLLVPKQLPKSLSPAVICQHGHGCGKDDVVGIARSPKAQDFIDEMNLTYAHKLAERGYVVLAPDAAGFGERESRVWEVGEIIRDTCFLNSMSALIIGKTHIGKRVWDIVRCVDFLQTQPFVDPGRIGLLGISGGGTITLFSAALEKRIKLAVVSGYFNTFYDSLFTVSGCTCNFVPGIMRMCDIADIAGLVAPRRLVIQSGEQDTLFPIDGAVSAFAELARIYDMLGKRDRLYHDIHPGGHAFADDKPFEWIDRFL